MIEKIKELTKDTAVYGISTIVGRFLNFLLVPFYTNVLNTNDFGIYSNVYAYLAFLNILFIYGMDAAYMKYASLATAEEKRRTFSTSMIFTAFTTILFAVILFVFMKPAGSLMELPAQYSSLYYYMILILVFDTTALVPYANLRLERRALKFSTIRLLNIVLNLVLNFVLVLKFEFGIEAIFIANLAASFFSLLLLSPEIVKNISLSIDKEILKKLLKFGLPYLPASMAAMIVQIIDRPVVLALTDSATLGIYQANYKLGIFMMLFVSMFQYAWQPFFLSNAKEKNAKEIFSKVLTLFLIAAGMIWIVISLFIDDFARIELLSGKSIIGKEYLSGLVIVPIILLGYLFNGVYYNFQAGIYIEEKTKYFPFVTGAGAAVNVAVNIILIPLLGIMGAALATLASYIIMALTLFIFSQKFYKIDYEYGKIIKILSVITAVCLVYYYIYFEVGFIFYYKLILLFAFIVSLFLLRVIQINEIMRIGKVLLRIK